MRMRAFFLAGPAALVAVAGLSFAISANAMPGDAGQISDADTLIAQAAPTPPPPPDARPGERRERRVFSPRAMCDEQVARRAGFRAYIKVRLNLKPEQMTAWSALEKAADDVTAKEIARCAALPAEVKTPPTFVDRMSMREEAMKTRLAEMEAVKPSMLALYNTLTPEQKVVLDRPFMGGDFGRGREGMEHGRR
jgi:LTXXQ motif family protein